MNWLCIVVRFVGYESWPTLLPGLCFGVWVWCRVAGEADSRDAWLCERWWSCVWMCVMWGTKTMMCMRRPDEGVPIDSQSLVCANQRASRKEWGQHGSTRGNGHIHTTTTTSQKSRHSYCNKRWRLRRTLSIVLWCRSTYHTVVENPCCHSQPKVLCYSIYR
jgi:hypothetical protein